MLIESAYLIEYSRSYFLSERSKVGEIFNFVLGAESSDLKIYSAELAFNLDAQFSRIKRMKSDDGSNEFRINDIVRELKILQIL